MTLKFALTDDQLGQFTRKTMAIADRLGKSLPFEDVMAALQRIHDGQFDKSPVPSTAIARVLELVETIEFGGCDGLVAKEKFKEGKTTDNIKIAWLGSNFKENFLAGEGKVEGVVVPSMLRVHKLKKASLDAPIISELGDTHQITLGEFWHLLKRQGTGQKGPLLVNGYANIAYIRDMNGTLWVVYACGRGVGWSVEARSVSGPHRWDVDFQVISR